MKTVAAKLPLNEDSSCTIILRGRQYLHNYSYMKTVAEKLSLDEDSAKLSLDKYSISTIIPRNTLSSQLSLDEKVSVELFLDNECSFTIIPT